MGHDFLSQTTFCSGQQPDLSINNFSPGFKSFDDFPNGSHSESGLHSEIGMRM